MGCCETRVSRAARIGAQKFGDETRDASPGATPAGQRAFGAAWREAVRFHCGHRQGYSRSPLTDRLEMFGYLNDAAEFKGWWPDQLGQAAGKQECYLVTRCMDRQGRSDYLFN